MAILRPAGEVDARMAFSWRVTTASVLTISVGMLPGFLPGALAVQLSDSMGIAVTGIGLVVGAFFAFSALLSPVMGWVAERLGWARAMRTAGLAAGLALGLTPLVARSLVTLGAVTVLAGAALALSHPAVNLSLARCTAVSRQGLVFGFKHAAIPASSALAGLALPVVAIPLGWGWVYALGAAVAVGAASLVPSSPGRFEVDPGHRDHEGEAGGRRSSLSLLVIVALGAGAGIFGADAMATFLVPYAVDVGFAEGSAGLLLAVGSASGILVRLMAGWQSDRASSASLTTVAVFLALGATGIVVLAIGAQIAVVVGTLLAFSLGWGWSGLLTSAVVRRNPGEPAAATGVTMTGIYIGAAAGPIVFGVLAERISFTAAWMAMATALGFGALLMMLAAARERS